MIPTPGRIVAYTLSSDDANVINKRRGLALNYAQANSLQGVIAYSGNSATAGAVYPMLIVRPWGELEGSAVNGQVFLDGTDTFWATSRVQGDGPGQWHEFPRVGK